jgi:hypothetical protein
MQIDEHFWIAIAIIGGGAIAAFEAASYIRPPKSWDIILIAAIIIPTTAGGLWIYFRGEWRASKSKKSN